ncbi:MAG: PD40 domain-containing protein [Verrucomicrobiales bacterium]|nr:PD40 domain-containing protein [Verrucomicrobiales bacterium]
MRPTLFVLIAGPLLCSFHLVSASDSQAGSRFPSERSTYRDSVTGRDVIRLTTSPAEDVKIYQTHPSWTADGKWIVFNSDRTGTPQLFAVHEEQGGIVQLTDEPGVNVGQVCLSRREPALLTLIGNEVVRLDFGESLRSPAVEANPVPPRRTVVGRIPEGAALSGTMSWNASETALLAGFSHGGGEGGARTWSVESLDLERRLWTTVLRPGFQVGHVQANPERDDLIMYCHETGGDADQRMWLVHADGTGNRPFYQESFDEWVTHELWWGGERALFTAWPKDDAMRRKPHGIASVTLDGVVRFHSRFPYWHVTGAAGQPYVVGDTFAGEIIRVEPETGERTVLTQGHRPKPQGAHPHVSLDPSGTKVLFNSTAEGNADLYLVGVEADGGPTEHAFRAHRYRAPSTPEAAASWQRTVRAELAALLKVDSLMGRDRPLNPRILRSDVGRYVDQEVEIDSTPGRKIILRVTLPREVQPPVPAVVCIHGHGGTRNSVHDRGSIYKGFAAELADRGWVTVAVNVGQHEVYEADRTLMGERLWDLMRCVDYVSTLPQTDTHRIGCAGLSLGGEMAMWLGAMDPRIRATVSSGFLTTMDQMEQNHCMCWKLDGLRELVDYADIYSLIAPRALQCQNGLREGPTDFWVPIARGAMADIRRIYSVMGSDGQVELDEHSGAHEIDLPSLVSFLNAHLSQTPSGRPD